MSIDVTDVFQSDVPNDQTNPSNTVIVLDWDDTILPTTWLERNRVLGVSTRLRPAMQNQLNALAQVADITIRLCQQLGTVIFITNSCPGWMEASCGQFMPSLIPFIRSIPIFAKSPHAPPSFKIDAFQAQCSRFVNVISIGDGIAERAATLKLLSPRLRGKSLKLRDSPGLSHLHQEHALVQERLSKVVCFWGNLDLRVQFSGSGEEKALLVHISKTTDSPSREMVLGASFSRAGASKPEMPLTPPTRINANSHYSTKRAALTPTFTSDTRGRPPCETGLCMQPPRLGGKVANNSCGSILNGHHSIIPGNLMPHGVVPCAWRAQTQAPTNMNTGHARLIAAYHGATIGRSEGRSARMHSVDEGRLRIRGSSPSGKNVASQLPRIRIASKTSSAEMYQTTAR